MTANWNDNLPIYLQLRDKAISMILDNALKEGDALPSVRKVAAEYRLNPITVSKAYQLLLEDGFVEKKRGLGMFVCEGAKERLLITERNNFLQREWPDIVARIHRLNLDVDDLIHQLSQQS